MWLLILTALLVELMVSVHILNFQTAHSAVCQIDSPFLPVHHILPALQKHGIGGFNERTSIGKYPGRRTRQLM